MWNTKLKLYLLNDLLIYLLIFRLFPLRERGLNPYAQTLTDEEIEVNAILFLICVVKPEDLSLWHTVMKLPPKSDLNIAACFCQCLVQIW